MHAQIILQQNDTDGAEDQRLHGGAIELIGNGAPYFENVPIQAKADGAITGVVEGLA